MLQFFTYKKNILFIILIICIFFVIRNAYTGIYNNSLLEVAINKFLIKPKGIIHIGASIGEEQDFYTSQHIHNIMWIEADPETFQKLIKNVKPNNTSIIAENFAASNNNGTARFLRTNNRVSSSFFPLKEHKAIWPGVKFSDEINVTTKTLDSYFTESKNRSSNYNIMVLDIQGAELLALEGATETLKNIDCIISEISYIELYEGGVLVYELDEFLLRQGFMRTETNSWNRGTGDALYVRTNIK